MSASDADLPGLPAMPHPVAALRHLARARAGGWPGGLRLPATALVVGASGLALSLARVLAARGVAVTVAESDPDAAARLQEQMRRQGVPARVSAAPEGPADLVIRTVDGQAPPAQPGTLTLRCVDAPDGAGGTQVRIVAPLSGLVEVYPGADALRAAALIRMLGGVPLLIPAGHEGPAARLVARLDAAAEGLAFAGAVPWELDDAAAALGFAPGPLARMDALGVDTALSRMRSLRPRLHDPGLIARMVAEGRLGRKGGVGWYRYPGGGGRVVDPLIEDLVREEAHFARQPQVNLPAPLLARALVLAMMDEAAHLLAEGAVRQASDIDLAAVLAAGFPARLGGPLFLAARWGRAATGDALARLAATLPHWPAPAAAWAAPEAP